MRGGFRLTSTPKRRFSLATVTSICSCPWPESSSSFVCGSRLYLIDGSSSSRRCIDVLILSSSPRVLGSIAYDSTGSGKATAGKVTVSLVSVSLSFATAPRSPALISGTFVCVLPWSSATWPSRSCVSRVLLWMVESALMVPATTRNIVMRPANGSAMVFHTKACAGFLSSAGHATSSPLLSTPL